MTQVHIMKNPSASQIDEMVQLMVASFGNDIAIRAMTGGDESLRSDLFRLTIQTAVLEGVIFVCQEPDSEKILSVGIAYGPGTSFLGSETQLAIPGISEFFKNISAETQEWWTTVNRPFSQKLVNECMGQEKFKASWYVITLTTLPTAQKKGYGSLIMQEICRKAAEDKAIVTLYTATDARVRFYKNLGFKIMGSGDRPSPFGTWKHYMMAWDSNLSQ